MKYILLLLLSYNLFALDTVSSGSVISAAKFNELINKINELEKKGVQQIVENKFSTRKTVSVGTYSTTSYGTEIPELTTTIITKTLNNKIIIDLSIFWESINDSIFKVVRFVNNEPTELGNTDPKAGVFVARYDYNANTDSTPQQDSISLIDTPNVNIGTSITYKVFAKRTHDSSTTSFVLNDSFNSGTDSYREKGFSSIIVTEIGL